MQKKGNMIIIDEKNIEVDFPTFERMWNNAEFDRDLFIQTLSDFGESQLCDCDEITKRAVKNLIYTYTHPSANEVAIYKKKYEEAAKKCDEATKKAEKAEADLAKEKDRADKAEANLSAEQGNSKILTDALNAEKANGVAEKERADKAEEDLKKANERIAELEAAQANKTAPTVPTVPTAPTAPITPASSTDTADYPVIPSYIKRSKTNDVGEAYLFYNGSNLVPNKGFAVKAMEVFDIQASDFAYYYAEVDDEGQIVPMEKASKKFKV